MFLAATPAPAAISELAALGTKTSSQAIGLYEYLKKHRTQTSLLEIETQAKLGNPNFVFSEEIYNHLIKLDGVVQSSSKNGSIRYLQYVPLVDLSTPEKLQQYIRTHSTKKGVPVKTIREEFLGDAIKLLDEWEKAGKILIMRSSGALQLPNPGAVAKKHNLERGSDAAAPGLMDVGSRNWRMVYWDYSRELGESPRGRLESELTQMWADITVEETDDIEKLLATMGHEVSAQEAAKKTAKKGPIKKKKQVARQLNKLTNTHLLAHVSPANDCGWLSISG